MRWLGLRGFELADRGWVVEARDRGWRGGTFLEMIVAVDGEVVGVAVERPRLVRRRVVAAELVAVELGERFGGRRVARQLVERLVVGHGRVGLGGGGRGRWWLRGKGGGS